MLRITTMTRRPLKALAMGVATGGLVFSLLGCETTGGSFQPDTLGTLIGSGTGALIGSQIGGGRGRILATGAGAVAGALIGREIARHLSQSGQEQMVQANQRALETGQPQEWQDPETGASGRTEVTARTTQRSQVPVSVKRDRVEQLPPIDLIGETYVADSSSNIRGGPSTEYRSVDSLAAGQHVQVVGKVQGRNWYLISEDGAASGFVATRLLRPAPAGQRAPAPTQPAAGADTMLVEANQTCSVNSTTVTQPDGSTVEERIRMCQGPDGYIIEEA